MRLTPNSYTLEVRGTVDNGLKREVGDLPWGVEKVSLARGRWLIIRWCEPLTAPAYVEHLKTRKRVANLPRLLLLKVPPSTQAEHPDTRTRMPNKCIERLALELMATREDDRLETHVAGLSPLVEQLGGALVFEERKEGEVEMGKKWAVLRDEREEGLVRELVVTTKREVLERWAEGGEEGGKVRRVGRKGNGRVGEFETPERGEMGERGEPAVVD